MPSEDSQAFRFKVRIKPKPDEILLSWLVRLAWANGLKVESFAHALTSGSLLLRTDIDRTLPAALAEKLSCLTGLQAETIIGMTLAGYSGYLFEVLPKNGQARWIMPIGKFGFKRRLFGQQFCRQCLREDRAPYFRKHWRLASSVICVQHSSYLHDRCPKCKSAVSFHEADFGRSPPPREAMAYCVRCGFDLRLASRKRNRPEPDAESIELQRNLDEILCTGWASVGTGTVYSNLFFDGVRRLWC